MGSPPPSTPFPFTFSGSIRAHVEILLSPTGCLVALGICRELGEKGGELESLSERVQQFSKLAIVGVNIAWNKIVASGLFLELIQGEKARLGTAHVEVHYEAVEGE